MKIQNNNYIPPKTNVKQTEKSPGFSIAKDGVTLGSTECKADFLKLGNLAEETSADFSKLNLSSAPYIMGGGAIGASVVGLCGLPLKYTLFAAGAGAFIGGTMKDFPIAAKITGVGAVVGAGLGAFNASPVGPIVGGFIGGAIGSIAGAISQENYGR